MPNVEYCCLKHSCNPVQSTTIGLNDSYHILASPVKVKQNLCTFATSGTLCVSINLFVLNRCASASSSGLPENSGLKYDQFNWGCTGIGICIGGISGCNAFGIGTGGTCDCIEFGIGTGGLGAGGICGCTGSGMSAGGAGAGGICGLEELGLVPGLGVMVLLSLVEVEGLAVEGQLF